ncbi:uncharacterized protein EAF01_006987 [Botrytis porri]|uniref:uncharacterized protein n=1 Tax=Botrytis porri TaxID=87229 RepID=UPI001901C842|nr:uncharacterized protein EAF01_006987 [Botrytis porri]KAF7901688.1 hypothetical protein EAF01_006987 [Botrytis porri]
MTSPTDLTEDMTISSPLTQQEAQPSFHRFIELPNEIRAKVWKYCLPEPRIVHMSSKHTRAQLYFFLQRPETWIQRRLEFSFYENGNDLYRGDQTQPEKSPLRHVCQESRKTWQDSYSIPEIQLSHQMRVKLDVQPQVFSRCRNGECISLRARYPAPAHMIPHSHKYYQMSDGRLFYLIVRGLIDMKRDTLIMDPVLFSLLNGDLGLDLNISKLRSIAYTSSIEHRPAWKPPRDDGRYQIIEDFQLFLSELHDGFHVKDPDINENLVVEQANDARDALVSIEKVEDMPIEKKYIASRDMWNFITKCCPQISSIQYILLGERNTAIYSNMGDREIFGWGNLHWLKYQWEIHEHHLLPLYPSVRKIIMSPENTPIHSQGWGIEAKSGLPIVGIQHHFSTKFNHGVQLEKDFQDYLKQYERSGNRKFWHDLKFQVCALGDAVYLGDFYQIAQDHDHADTDMDGKIVDVEPEGEIPFEFTSGYVSPSSSSSSLPSNPEECESENSIPQNKGQIVKAPTRGVERSFLCLEMGIYIHWDPRGAPVQVTRRVRQ